MVSSIVKLYIPREDILLGNLRAKNITNATLHYCIALTIYNKTLEILKKKNYVYSTKTFLHMLFTKTLILEVYTYCKLYASIIVFLIVPVITVLIDFQIPNQPCILGIKFFFCVAEF